MTVCSEDSNLAQQPEEVGTELLTSLAAGIHLEGALLKEQARVGGREVRNGRPA